MSLISLELDEQANAWTCPLPMMERTLSTGASVNMLLPNMHMADIIPALRSLAIAEATSGPSTPEEAENPFDILKSAPLSGLRMNSPIAFSPADDMERKAVPSARTFPVSILEPRTASVSEPYPRTYYAPPRGEPRVDTYRLMHRTRYRRHVSEPSPADYVGLMGRPVDCGHPLSEDVGRTQGDGYGARGAHTEPLPAGKTVGHDDVIPSSGKHLGHHILRDRGGCLDTVDRHTHPVVGTLLQDRLGAEGQPYPRPSGASAQQIRLPGIGRLEEACDMTGTERLDHRLRVSVPRS